MLLAGLSSSFVFFIQKVKSNLLSSIQYGTKRKSMMTKLWPRNSRHKIYIMWGEGCTKKQTKIRKKKKKKTACVCVCVCGVCVSKSKIQNEKENYTDPFISIIHGAEGSMRRREITDSVNSKR